MEGLIHRADIYRRVQVAGHGQWETSAFITDLQCRIDSISPSKILREQYASCTHSAVASPNSDIQQGMRMVVTSTGWAAGKVFAITGIRALDAGVPGPHHQELLLTEDRLVP